MKYHLSLRTIIKKFVAKTITPNQTTKKINEKEVYENRRDDREKAISTYNLRYLVRSADNKKAYGKGDSTNCFDDLHTKTIVIFDTIPGYRINFLPER